MVVKVSELGAATVPLTGAELVHVVQSAVSKQATTADIAALATAGGTSDARDGIRTWEAPYNVSKDASAATNTTGINQAILDARSHARGAEVFLPQGIINVNAPIIVYPGTRLRGQAPANNANGTTTSSGTTLFLAASSNCNVIQDSGWAGQSGSWNRGEIRDLYIDANQANNASGLSAIAIYAMGETSLIERVHVRNAKRYGVEIKAGSSPATLRQVAAEANLLGAVYHEGNGPLLIESLWGENNDGRLIHLKGGTGASVTILNGRQGSPADIDVPVLDLEDFQGSVQMLGGYFLSPSSGGSPSDALVVIRGTNGPGYVRLSGVQETEHTLTLDDQINGRTYARRATGSVGAVAELILGSEIGIGSGVLTIQPSGVAVGAGPKLGAGTGAPTAAWPNGSMWFRTDGGAGTTVYLRRSGAWSGIH